MPHLRTLKTLNFVLGAITGLFSLACLAGFVLPGLIMCSDGEEGGGIAVLLGLIFFALTAILAGCHVVVGYMVSTGRGRVGQTMLAAMSLTNFPLGTAYAVYALWVCWLNAESKKAFERGYKPPIT